jgi:F-box and leucine-rich repeat protein GRR1
VFCVFSGQGVIGLRRYLNSERDFADLHDPLPGEVRHRNGHAGFAGAPNAPPPSHTHHHGDGAFDDAEPDVVDDDDGLEDGSEMAVDTQPLMGPLPVLATDGQASATPPVPPPPPQLPFLSAPSYRHDGVEIRHGQSGFASGVTPRVLGLDEEDADDAMDTTPARPSTSNAGAAPLGLHGFPAHQSSRSRQASGAGPVPAELGPSTASIQRATPGRGTPPGLSDATGSGPSQSHGNNAGNI